MIMKLYSSWCEWDFSIENSHMKWFYAQEQLKALFVHFTIFIWLNMKDLGLSHIGKKPLGGGGGLIY